MVSTHVQQAVASLLSALEDIEHKQRELQAEKVEIQQALTALGVKTPGVGEATTIRERILQLAANGEEFETKHAISYIYGRSFVERAQYSTVSSALAALVKDRILQKPGRGKFLLPPTPEFPSGGNFNDVVHDDYHNAEVPAM